MEDVYKPIFSAWQEAAGEKNETQIMKKKWTVGSGRHGVTSHCACSICIVQFAFANLQ
jgi:hypothetical protein